MKKGKAIGGVEKTQKQQLQCLFLTAGFVLSCRMGLGKQVQHRGSTVFVYELHLQVFNPHILIDRLFPLQYRHKMEAVEGGVFC